MTTIKTFCAMFLAVSFAAFAAPVAAPFAKGEVIHYAIKKVGIKVGEATLEFKGETKRDGKKYTLIVFTAKGFNFFDEERIFVDGKTFRPKFVDRDLNIFGKKAKVTEEYDQAAGTVTITKVAKGGTTVQVLEKTGPIDNIYGIIYRYRIHGGFDREERFEVALPALDITMAGVKNMKFKAAGKTYQSLLLRSVPSQYSIWMDRGPAHLPLRIAGAVGLANTVMTMVEYTP
ncbi:MAG TPA: hypothetical protein DCM68_01340 [Verrucomicrobia bacterium]|nr:hypothetical protein [Verrucomicrobiota bacterium]